MFGSPQSSSGNGSTAWTKPAYGNWRTGLSYTCYATGGPCSRSVGYDRICYTDACGGWKGKSADYMLDHGAFGSCEKCSRWWCDCSRWN